MIILRVDEILTAFVTTMHFSFLLYYTLKVVSLTILCGRLFNYSYLNNVLDSEILLKGDDTCTTAKIKIAKAEPFF